MSRRQPTLYTGARVHTLGAATPEAAWFTVLGDRFQEVGVGEPPPLKRRVELGGRTVVPGFVDSHIHFFQTGLDRLFIDLTGLSTRALVVDALERQAQGKRSWVFAAGYEEDPLAEDAPLTRHDLDAAFPDRPVWVNRVDYHSAIANTLALRSLDVPSGMRGLMKTRGKPNGILRAEAYMHARTRVARAQPLWMREAAVKEAVKACVARGITAVHALEGGALFGDEGVHALLKRMPKLPIDVTLFLQEKNVFFTEQLGFNHLGGCILIDGSIGSYTAAIDNPYPTAGTRGLLYESARSLKAFIQGAHAAGAQLAFHAIGPRAIEVVLRSYEEVLRREPRYDHRHRIEHFELATDEQIRRLAALGGVPAMQPAFEHFWGGPDRMYADRLGDRWRQTNRLRDILDAGIRIAGGSDASVTPPDPLLGVHAAVNHPNPEQRITPLEGLRMMTLDAAWAAFNETRHGSIEAGKEASFVVLEADPVTCARETIKDIRVLETWSRGKRVHRAGAEDPVWETGEEV